MIDVAVMFGANRSTAETELRDTLQFEIELAKVELTLRPIFATFAFNHKKLPFVNRSKRCRSTIRLQLGNCKQPIRI